MTNSFGKYELIDRIGKGGMAEVFLAKSVGAQGVEKTLVIKKILPELATNDRFIDMFIAEAKIAMGLNHPNIVQIYDFGRVDRDYYLAMEHVDGFELGRLLTASKSVRFPLPIGDAVYLAMEAARGLDYAHRRRDSFGESLGLVHRDISPQNLLVSRDGALKIVDFGIAKASSVADDGPGIVKGKYQYMSPEQASGQEVDHRSDLFSLGVVLFEMLCGRSLFRAETPEETVSLVLSAVVPSLLEINPKIPEQLEHLVYKALALDPEERFDNAREFQVELTRVLYSLADIHDATTVAQHSRQVEALLPEDSVEMILMGDGEVGEESQTVRTRAPRTFSGGGTPQIHTGRTPAIDKEGVQAALSRQRKEVVIVAGAVSGIEMPETDELHEQLLEQYQRIIDSIAFKYDAVVHEIDPSTFVVLLGIPISNENDSERAARMALDIQEAIMGLGLHQSPPLEVRLYVSIGEVILEHEMDASQRQYEWSFRGDCRKQALDRARQMGKAEVFVDEQAHQRIRRNFRCETTEFEYFRVIGPKSPRDQIQELRSSFQSFYGREIPQRLLRDTFRQVLLKERARAIVLVGPAGVGKSTLVEKFLAGLNPREVRVVRGVASPFDRDVPLASAVGFFSEMMRIDLRDDEEGVREKVEARIGALFVEESEEEMAWLLDSLFHLFGVPRQGNFFEELSGEERRKRLFLSLSRLMNRFATSRPLVLAIDDVHFIDPMMMAVTAQFFDRSQKAPVFFVGTARDVGSHIESRSWQELLASRNLKVEVLGELAASEAEKMVRDRLEMHQLDDEALVEMVLTRSGGNPLYIKEVIDSIEESSGSVRDSAELLPANVEGLIAARLDRLPVEERDALQRLSLLRSPFSLPEARSVLDAHSEEVLDILVERDVLRGHGDDGPGKKYRFANALIQEVAARSLVPEEAKVLHRRIADHLLLARGRNDSVLVARHLDAAGDGERALAIYVDALQRALDEFGAAECLRLCQRVLLHQDVGEGQRFQALKWREEALQGLGERAEAEAALEELEALAPLCGDAADQIYVAIRRARFCFREGEFAASRQAVARALEIAKSADDRLGMALAWRTEAVVDLTEGRRDRALGLIDRAIASLNMKTGREVQEEMVRAYNMRGVILRQSGRHREALEAYETALAGAEAVESAALVRQLLTNSALALAYVGEFSEAKRRYQRALDACRRLGHRRDEGLVLVNLGHVCQMMGRSERAIAYIRRGIYLARRTDDVTTVIDGTISLGLTYLEKDDVDEAQALLEQGLVRADSIPHAYLAVCAVLGLVEVHLSSDEEEEIEAALSLAQDGLRRSEEAGLMWGVATSHEMIARALDRLGEGERALQHSRRAVEILDEADIYGIDQILVTHAETLPDEPQYDEERRRCIERAVAVFETRRDAIDDEEDRKAFVARAINRKIRRLTGLLRLEEVSTAEEVSGAEED